MQTLMIPQSPIVDNRGLITQEWLVFMNELIRLSNTVISSDVVNKADDNDELIITSLAQPSVYTPENYELTTYVAPIIEQDEVIQNTPLSIAQDEPIQSTSIQITQDDQTQDNPYALISSIEQQLYDQQIWSLNA